MNTLRIASRFLPALPLALLPALPLAGHTWIVDDDGGAGVDFTDIEPAIQAATAGDLILVRAGSYSSFMLTEGLTILGPSGSGVAHVASGSRVSQLPAGATAVIADLMLRNLRVRNCDGTVVLEHLGLSAGNPGFPQYVEVFDSGDVRLHACTIGGQLDSPTPRIGLRATDSRTEIASSTIRGDFGQLGYCGPVPGGAQAVHKTGATQAQLLHVADSMLVGGNGGSTTGPCGWAGCGAGSGRGGLGLFSGQLTSGYSAVVCGGPGAGIAGGDGGDAECWCSSIGGPEAGIYGEGLVRQSGLTISGGTGYCDGLPSGTAPPFFGSVQSASPVDPALFVDGTIAPGQTVTFHAVGETGSTASLILGRHPLVQSTPGVLIERLTTHDRVFPMGTIGASGVVDKVFVIPPFLAQGFVFFAQAEVQPATGPLQRSNSVPVLLR